MADLPWFPFYPSDWLSSTTVQLLTLGEEGAFIRLLSYAWLSNACALPKDEIELKRLCKWDDIDEDFHRVLACFQPHPELKDHLCNPRLYKEWLRIKQQQTTLSNRGLAGASKRWGKPKKIVTLIVPAQPVIKSNGRGSIFPPEFTFDERANELAQSYGLNPHKELAAFRDHAAAKGRICKDWQAAFRNWLRNTVKFKEQRR